MARSCEQSSKLVGQPIRQGSYKRKNCTSTSLMFLVFVLNIAVVLFGVQPTLKHPDFKNKDSGQALWIGTKSPQWAVDALPSLNFKGGSKGTRKETLLS